MALFSGRIEGRRAQLVEKIRSKLFLQLPKSFCLGNPENSETGIKKAKKTNVSFRSVKLFSDSSFDTSGQSWYLHLVLVNMDRGVKLGHFLAKYLQVGIDDSQFRRDLLMVTPAVRCSVKDAENNTGK